MEPTRFEIAKLDPAQRLVFGFAQISVASDGTPLEDLQGDLIEPDELEKAAYRFMEDSAQQTGEMHEGGPKGRLVESMVFTPEKLAKMGLPADAIGARWWVGFRVDPDTFEKAQRGVLKYFSIQGRGERVEV